MQDCKFLKRGVVKKGHTNGEYVHVKHLCGNGHLYIRMVSSRVNIVEKDATLATGSESDDSSPSCACTSFVRLCNAPNSASDSAVPLEACDQIDDDGLPEIESHCQLQIKMLQE